MGSFLRGLTDGDQIAYNELNNLIWINKNGEFIRKNFYLRFDRWRVSCE
jgi:hypothetical protein